MPRLTLILVSHRIRSMAVCDRLFELRSGRLGEIQWALGADAVARVVPLVR